MKNILLFSDFGIDDFVAAIYALFNEELNIVGVVADYGNVSKEDAIRNADYLRRITGANVPVFAGADLPLTGERPTFFPDIHGLEGLGPIIPESNEGIPFENFDGVKTIINAYEDEIIIVNVGRLSSLATAFILYPELMKKVKDFYIMGGAFTVPGNITPVSEANFYGDPYAANIILNTTIKPVYIIPLDVTSSALITPAMIDDLHQHFQTTNNQVGLIIKPMVDYYFNFYKKRDPTISGSPLHDLFTLWAILRDSQVQYKSAPVRVVIEKGDSFGQSLADLRRGNDKVNWPNHLIALSYSYRHFIQSFMYTMRNYTGKDG